MDITTRSQRWFNYWYQPEIRMGKEEYLTIAILAASWVLAWNLGILIGWLITLTL